MQIELDFLLFHRVYCRNTYSITNHCILHSFDRAQKYINKWVLSKIVDLKHIHVIPIIEIQKYSLNYFAIHEVVNAPPYMMSH